jgi:hypothetical protein
VEEGKMSPSPADLETGASPSSRRGLRWWHWLLFLLPGLVAVATTWILTAMELAMHPERPREYLLLAMGLYGIVTGAVFCLISGVLLGLTTRVRHRVLACIGWTLLCALTNLPIAFAGCTLIESTMPAPPNKAPAQPAEPAATATKS